MDRPEQVAVISSKYRSEQAVLTVTTRSRTSAERVSAFPEALGCIACTIWRHPARAQQWPFKDLIRKEKQTTK
jgi:hypothetical protein